MEKIFAVVRISPLIWYKNIFLLLLFLFPVIIPFESFSQQNESNDAIRKRMENQYEGFVSKGDFDFSNERFNDAKGNYQKALEMNPGKSYPIRQIQKIDSLLLVNKAYESAIERADFFFKTSKWEEAKNYYLNAVKIKGRSQYAENKVDYIDSIMQSKNQLAYLNDLENIHFKRKGISDEEQYSAYIVKADEAFKAKQYSKAGRYYEWALLVLPKKEYALSQLDKVYDILERENAAQTGLAERRNRHQDSLRQVQSRKFYQAVDNAKRSIQQGQLELAVTYYSEAGRAWPEKAADTDQLIAFVRETQASRSQNEKQYEQVVGDADREYLSQEYKKARLLYVQASELMPSNSYPHQQIVRTDSLINMVDKPFEKLLGEAQAFEDQNKYEEAIGKYEEASRLKPASKLPASKINDLQRRAATIQKTTEKTQQNHAAYLEVIKKADLAFRDKDYATAALNYELAANLKPFEKYPADKLNELKDIQNQRKTDYQQNIDSRTEKQYNDAVSVADEHFKAGRYDEARAYYKRAFLYKPSESYSQKQLSVIDELSSKSLRKELEEKAGQDTDRQQITEEIKSGLSKTEKDQLLQFQELQRQADDAFNKQDFSVARVYYQRSLAIRPNDEYAKKQIGKIAGYLKARKNEESNQQYQENLQKANQAFQKGDFSVARYFYQYAQKLSPKEPYPGKQLEAITKIETELQNQEKERQYLRIIATADSAYYQENFPLAKYQYAKALELKSGDNYAQSRLENIRQVLELQQNDKISKAYLEELRLADKAFFQGDFAKAGFYYKKALSLKPDEDYPKQQIKKIDTLTK